MQTKANNSKTPPSANFQKLMRRLSQAGFDREFVRQALLPDWWDEDCDQDPLLITDVEIRVARFLGTSLGIVKDPITPLVFTTPLGTSLRRVRSVDGERLKPAIHLAVRIANAVVHNLRQPTPEPLLPPDNGSQWRKEINPEGNPVTLDQILDDLWVRGIPVVPLDIIPSPSFQAIACVVESRPVILLGYKYDEPGRLGFLLAHEAGHIAAGDCNPDHLVLDGEEGIVDDGDIEVRADQYARSVLVGNQAVPQLDGRDFKEIAKQAAEQERSSGIDAGFLVANWASKSRDYAKATMALKALYRNSGARQKVSRQFHSNIDLATATETDRNLLRCVYGESSLYEAVG